MWQVIIGDLDFDIWYSQLYSAGRKYTTSYFYIVDEEVLYENLYLERLEILMDGQ